MDISFYKKIKYPILFTKKLINLIIKYNKYLEHKPTKNHIPHIKNKTIPKETPYKDKDNKELNEKDNGEVKPSGNHISQIENIITPGETSENEKDNEEVKPSGIYIPQMESETMPIETSENKKDNDKINQELNEKDNEEVKPSGIYIPQMESETIPRETSENEKDNDKINQELNEKNNGEVKPSGNHIPQMESETIPRETSENEKDNDKINQELNEKNNGEVKPSGNHIPQMESETIPRETSENEKDNDKINQELNEKDNGEVKPSGNHIPQMDSETMPRETSGNEKDNDKINQELNEKDNGEVKPSGNHIPQMDSETEPSDSMIEEKVLEIENIEIDNLRDTPVPPIEDELNSETNNINDNLKDDIESVINNLTVEVEPSKNPIPHMEELNISIENDNYDFKGLKLDDKFTFYFMKYFFRIFHSYLVDINLLKLFRPIKKSHNRTYSLVENHQKLLKKNVYNLKRMFEYKNRVRKFVINKSLENQIKYWEGKSVMLEAINDSSFGEGFMIRLLQNYESINFQKELIERLILIKKLFGLEFLKLNNILLFTLEQFETFDFQIRSKIFLKFILKLRFILKNDIKILKKTSRSLELIKYLYN